MKYLILFSILGLMACTTENKRQKAIDEITQAEADFAQMVADSSMAVGFMHFAAEDAVMLRNDKIIHGSKAFEEYLNGSTLTNIKLSWKPDFVDAAESGDLGYTYGSYTFSATDTAGNALNSQGIFHTVWRKQADGQWRFVWD